MPSIVKMCIWMEVSRSGFYDWRDKPESATARRRGELTLYVKKSFGDSDGTYGYRRVRADLVAWGVSAGPELVRSLMRELGLKACWKRGAQRPHGRARRSAAGERVRCGNLPQDVDRCRLRPRCGAVA